MVMLTRILKKFLVKRNRAIALKQRYADVERPPLMEALEPRQLINSPITLSDLLDSFPDILAICHGATLLELLVGGTEASRRRDDDEEEDSGNTSLFSIPLAGPQSGPSSLAAAWDVYAQAGAMSQSNSGMAPVAANASSSSLSASAVATTDTTARATASGSSLGTASSWASGPADIGASLNISSLPTGFSASTDATSDTTAGLSASTSASGDTSVTNTGTATASSSSFDPSGTVSSWGQVQINPWPFSSWTGDGFGNVDTDASFGTASRSNATMRGDGGGFYGEASGSSGGGGVNTFANAGVFGGGSATTSASGNTCENAEVNGEVEIWQGQGNYMAYSNWGRSIASTTVNPMIGLVDDIYLQSFGTDTRINGKTQSIYKGNAASLEMPTFSGPADVEGLAMTISASGQADAKTFSLPWSGSTPAISTHLDFSTAFAPPTSHTNITGSATTMADFCNPALPTSIDSVEIRGDGNTWNISDADINVKADNAPAFGNVTGAEASANMHFDVNGSVGPNSQPQSVNGTMHGVSDGDTGGGAYLMFETDMNAAVGGNGNMAMNQTAKNVYSLDYFTMMTATGGMDVSAGSVPGDIAESTYYGNGIGTVGQLQMVADGRAMSWDTSTSSMGSHFNLDLGKKPDKPVSTHGEVETSIDMMSDPLFSMGTVYTSLVVPAVMDFENQLSSRVDMTAHGAGYLSSIADPVDESGMYAYSTTKGVLPPYYYPSAVTSDVSGETFAQVGLNHSALAINNQAKSNLAGYFATSSAIDLTNVPYQLHSIITLVPTPTFQFTITNLTLGALRVGGGTDTYSEIKINIAHDANLDGIAQSGESIWVARAKWNANGGTVDTVGSGAGTWTDADFAKTPSTGVATLTKSAFTTSYVNAPSNTYIMEVHYATQASGDTAPAKASLSFKA